MEKLFNTFPERGRKWSARALAVVLAGALAGCSLLPPEDEPLKPPLAKPASVRTDTVEAKLGTIVKKVKGTAVLEPTEFANHRFTHSGGRVREVLVKAGDTVRQGDVLVRLEMENLETELLQKEIEVERKRVALDETRSQGGDERRLRIARLELELAEKLLASVREQVESRELKAEMDGVVTFVDDIEPGDFVEAYRVLVTVSDPSKLRLAYRLNGNENLSEISVGMTAEVTMGNRTFTGKVVQTPLTAPFTEDQRLAQAYARMMYIEPDELPEDAEMGDFADVEIVTAVRENVIVIPKNGLRKYFGRVYVQILDGETRRDIDVEAGLETSTEVEIVKGLQEGQQVVLQ
jgi:macrolide-specific efflux system membrane fusion protein